jgi:plastocyanin
VRPLIVATATLLAGTLQAGCSDAARPTEPAALASSAAGPGALSVGIDRFVNMMDACDPSTFNAAVGPGTCVRNGGMTFAKFIAQLTRHQAVGAWHFAPPKLQARVGETLVAVNRGGEVHTFTEVEDFGGGIVPQLNQLSGNPVPAPECLKLEPDDFVRPGETYRDRVSEAGTELYQCCIHPWMRTEVHARR